MNDSQIKHTLNQLAEGGIPAEADLWPALRARLAARRPAALAEKGYPMLKSVLVVPRPARALGAASVIVTLLAVALLATPQGRAWAQTAWQLFTLAPVRTFAVTPATVPQAGAPTAAPPAVNAAGCGADLGCQVASAEALLGFTAVVPAEGWAGLRLRAVDASGGLLRLSYAAQGGGGLVLSQGQGNLTASPWEEVAPEAVQAVQIGGVDAELVQGTFVVPAGASSAVWSSDAPVLRLRWQQGDRYFELAKLGDPEHLAHLDQAALIALAESLR